MQQNPLLIQTAVSVPITAGLVVYTLLRRDRSTLHLLLAGLLVLAAMWLAAMTGRMTLASPALQSIAFDLEILSIVIMPPFFVVTMGYFARSPAIEQSRAGAVSLFAVFAVFYGLYLTNSSHGLFITNRELAIAGVHPERWAGPFYWALQTLCGLADLVAFGLIVSAMRDGSNDHRRRALTVGAAIIAPIAAHFLYVLEWIPLDYSLAPGAMGATAIFFVHGIHRYGLLESHPIVRHDLINHLDDGLLLAQPDGAVLDANRVARQILRADMDQLRGRNLASLLRLLEPHSDPEPLIERISRLPIDADQIRSEITTRDGRWIEVAASTVKASGSQPAGRFVVLRDRTEQRRGERLLRERQKLESVGILAAGVAHEVNNPLAFVRANLVHLQSICTPIEKHFPPDAVAHAASGDNELHEVDEILAESLEGLDRIAGIVEGMLRFSRVPDEAFRQVDVGQVLAESIRLAALQRNRAVRLETASDDALPPVFGAPERLVQVLLNLLLNAKQALAKQSDAWIRCEARVEGSWVVIRVRDNGPGIPEAHQSLVFDPFYTTRGPDEGTGLGLSIAFDIVREHGGTLDVESRSGDGCCFTIRLPVAAS